MRHLKKYSKRCVTNIFILCLLTIIIVLDCKINKDDVIKIGAVLPLTGDVAVWGNNTKEGIDLAVEIINKNGGLDGKMIKIIYEDSQALPAKGVTAITKLIKLDNVSAVIDNSVSSVTLAMAPIAEKNETVILATGATAPAITNAGDFIFRIWNSDDLEGRVIAEYAFNELKIKKIAILFVNNDYGYGLKDVFEEEYIKLGGSVTVIEKFEQSETNFKPQLTKIKSDNPESIYLVGYPREVAQCLKQTAELGLNSIVLSTVAFEDPYIIELAKNASEGVIYPYPVTPDVNNEKVKSFYDSYQNKYNKDPGITCDVGYDAVNMLLEAMILSKGQSGSDIKEGLMMIKNYHGVSGIMEFDKNGDVHKPIGFKTVQNQKFIWINN